MSSSSQEQNSPGRLSPCSSNGASVFDNDDFLDGSVRRDPNRTVDRSVSDPIVDRIIYLIENDPAVYLGCNLDPLSFIRYLRSHLWRRDHNQLICRRCDDFMNYSGQFEMGGKWNITVPVDLALCGDQLMRRVLG